MEQKNGVSPSASRSRYQAVTKLKIFAAKFVPQSLRGFRPLQKLPAKADLFALSFATLKALIILDFRPLSRFSVPLIPKPQNRAYPTIYWNNHHHLLHATQRISGGILWANLHLLFWLSLFPFVTGWMGENHFASLPTALYGFVLLMAAIGYWVLQRMIVASEGVDSLLARAIGKDLKGNLSVVIYATAIPVAFFNQWLSQAGYVLVALMWLVPDRRIEKVLTAREN
jgi:Endosomal/lysosomal potassium channel TMEM175